MPKCPAACADRLPTIALESEFYGCSYTGLGQARSFLPDLSRPFCAQRKNPTPGIRFVPWGSPPEEQGFQGGDLLGIVDKLDYLERVGRQCALPEPRCLLHANHRYHTYDYYMVDPLLGGNDALRAARRGARTRDACRAGRRLHPRQPRLLGLPSHPGDRRQLALHRFRFYGVNNWPLYPYPADDHTSPNYAAWWGPPGAQVQRGEPSACATICWT